MQAVQGDAAKSFSQRNDAQPKQQQPSSVVVKQRVAAKSHECANKEKQKKVRDELPHGAAPSHRDHQS